jgi:hypothetical protein
LSVHSPTWAQTERSSWTVIPSPSYASRRSAIAPRSAVSAPENPFRLCVPSQKGFFCEPPHRHRKAFPSTDTTSPAAFSMRTGPSTM